MMTRTSSKATTSPMMTLVSSFGWSDSWLSWELWGRGRVRGLQSCAPPHLQPLSRHTYHHHQPQL